MQRSNSHAQGTIEYLVILAVVVVISLVVVGLFTGIFSNSSQQVSVSSDGFSSVSGGISVVESVIDPQGDSLIKFSNNSSDVLTLTRISVGGVDNNYNEQIVGLGSKTFSLSGLNFNCPCVSGQKSTKCDLKIQYTTVNGLVQNVNRTINADCVNDSNAVNPIMVVQPIVSQVIVLEDGTITHPWVINNCTELQNINSDLTAYYILGNNIDCVGISFDPIGDESTAFTGNFDGKDYNILNLVINTPWYNYTALFSYSQGTISNVGIVEATMSGTGFVAGLVGWQNGGTISNCFSSGTINGNGDYVGGLVGQQSSGLITISDSVTNAINSNGGNSLYYPGGAGGIININNSKTGILTSTGGSAWDGGAGGSINITGTLTQTGTCSTIGANTNDSGNGGAGGNITITSPCPTLANIGAFTCTGGLGASNGADGSCPHTCS